MQWIASIYFVIYRSLEEFCYLTHFFNGFNHRPFEFSKEEISFYCEKKSQESTSNQKTVNLTAEQARIAKHKLAKDGKDIIKIVAFAGMHNTR